MARTTIGRNRRPAANSRPPRGELYFKTPAVLDQAHYRGRNDDGDETTATWKAADDTPWTQAVDANFRVRFSIDETVGVTPQDENYQLQYNLNSAGWNNVDAASSVVRTVTSPNVPNSTPTTRQLTAPPGSFKAGEVDTNNGLAGAGEITGGDFTEHEYCAQVRSVDVVDADSIQLRLIGAIEGVLDVYTNTPTITVSEGAAPQVGQGQGRIRLRSNAVGIVLAAGSGRLRLRSRAAATVIGTGIGRLRLWARVKGGVTPQASQGQSRIRLRSRAVGQALAKGTGRIRVRSRSIGIARAIGQVRIRLRSRVFGGPLPTLAQGQGRLRLRSRAAGRAQTTGTGRLRLRSRAVGLVRAIGAGRIRLRSRSTGITVVQVAGRGWIRLRSRATGTGGGPIIQTFITEGDADATPTSLEGDSSKPGSIEGGALVGAGLEG